MSKKLVLPQRNYGCVVYRCPTCNVIKTTTVSNNGFYVFWCSHCNKEFRVAFHLVIKDPSHD